MAVVLRSCFDYHMMPSSRNFNGTLGYHQTSFQAYGRAVGVQTTSGAQTEGLLHFAHLPTPEPVEGDRIAEWNEQCEGFKVVRVHQPA